MLWNSWREEVGLWGSEKKSRKDRSKKRNWNLYPACLREMSRVCRPGTGRAVLLTQDKKCFTKVLYTRVKSLTSLFVHNTFIWCPQQKRMLDGPPRTGVIVVSHNVSETEPRSSLKTASDFLSQLSNPPPIAFKWEDFRLF